MRISLLKTNGGKEALNVMSVSDRELGDPIFKTHVMRSPVNVFTARSFSEVSSSVQ